MDAPVFEGAASPTPGVPKSAPVKPWRNRRNLRFALYALLILCDALAIRAAFEIGVSLKGHRWLSPNGVELGWVILPIHVLLGLQIGAFSRDAITSRLESVRRGTSAFIVATALVCMLIFFQYAGILVSRLAFGAAMVCSVVFIALGRIVFISLFVARQGEWMTESLLILDRAEPIPQFGGTVIDARAEELEPDVRDPARLAAFAERIAGADRVIVVCGDADRRSRWAHMLKSFDVTGEIVLGGGNPLGAIGLGRLYGQETVVVSRGPLSLGNRMKKRATDLVLASAALLFLSPLLILTAIAIKLDSRGPVFFAQPRVGRGNRMFRILKFRSMRTETTDLAGDRSTARDDDRITRVGAFIRKTSIDELPQLFNVVAGSMSVVGPRPHALGSLAGEKLFWEVDDTYWRRHQLKPGITGLAQVRGFRGATHQQVDLEHRLQADLEYVAGWSLWRDIKIIFATLRVIVHPRAY